MKKRLLFLTALLSLSYSISQAQDKPSALAPTFSPETFVGPLQPEAQPEKPSAENGEPLSEIVHDLVPKKHFRKWQAAGIPMDALNKMRQYIQKIYKDGTINKITNHNHIVFIDLTNPSKEQRFYLLNVKTGNFMQKFVAHGKNSGTFFAFDFSKANEIGSLQTTPGFHVVAEKYNGDFGTSYRLDGLEERNLGARARDVVLHRARYVSTRFLEAFGGKRMGLSWGCPAVSHDTMKTLLAKNLSGALLYNYTFQDAPGGEKRIEEMMKIKLEQIARERAQKEKEKLEAQKKKAQAKDENEMTDEEIEAYIQELIDAEGIETTTPPEAPSEPVTVNDQKV